MLKETGGDAFSVGATRTYKSGRKETVIERDNEGMFLKWTLVSEDVSHYEGFFRIDDDRIFWKIQGDVPHEADKRKRSPP